MLSIKIFTHFIKVTKLTVESSTLSHIYFNIKAKAFYFTSVLVQHSVSICRLTCLIGMDNFEQSTVHHNKQNKIGKLSLAWHPKLKILLKGQAVPPHFCARVRWGAVSQNCNFGNITHENDLRMKTCKIASELW